MAGLNVRLNLDASKFTSALNEAFKMAGKNAGAEVDRGFDSALSKARKIKALQDEAAKVAKAGLSFDRSTGRFQDVGSGKFVSSAAAVSRVEQAGKGPLAALQGAALGPAGLAAGAMIGSSPALQKTLERLLQTMGLIVKPLGDLVSVGLQPLIELLKPFIPVATALFRPLAVWIRKLLVGVGQGNKEFLKGLGEFLGLPDLDKNFVANAVLVLLEGVVAYFAITGAIAAAGALVGPAIGALMASVSGVFSASAITAAVAGGITAVGGAIMALMTSIGAALGVSSIMAAVGAVALAALAGVIIGGAILGLFDAIKGAIEQAASVISGDYYKPPIGSQTRSTATGLGPDASAFPQFAAGVGSTPALSDQYKISPGGAYRPSPLAPGGAPYIPSGPIQVGPGFGSVPGKGDYRGIPPMNVNQTLNVTVNASPSMDDIARTVRKEAQDSMYNATKAIANSTGAYGMG